jgi:hypothetical protein
VEAGAELALLLSSSRLMRGGEGGSGDIGGVGTLGVLLRFDFWFVFIVSSSGFLATLMGKGRCRIPDWPSGRRDDRGGKLGGDELLVNRESGRRAEGDCVHDSMLATIITGVIDKVGKAGSISGSGSGAVDSDMMAENVNLAAVAVTGVVLSSTVSGMS